MQSKPGYKTSEFWLSLLAKLAAFCLAAAAMMDPNLTTTKALLAGGTGIAGMLAAFGYTSKRAEVKTADVPDAPAP